MDPLSDVLAVVRLSGAIFYDVDVSAPWSATSPAVSELKRALPGSRHLMAYHIVREGEVWALPVHGDPIHLRTGSMIVFPHGDAHAVASEAGMGGEDPRNATDIKLTLRPPFLVRGGGLEGPRTKMICGFFGCDAKPFNPLLSCLPPVILVDATTEDSGDLGVFFRLAVGEVNAGALGGTATLQRLGELMLIEAIRRHMRERASTDMNWLSALLDTHIGQAIRAIHAEPTKGWTVAALAKHAGMSRTSFAERFTELAATTPMNYVRLWRMQLAAGTLADGGTVSAAAQIAGYESEASFSRAFQKATGQAPGIWRSSTEAHAP